MAEKKKRREESVETPVAPLVDQAFRAPSLTSVTVEERRKWEAMFARFHEPHSVVLERAAAAATVEVTNVTQEITLPASACFWEKIGADVWYTAGDVYCGYNLIVTNPSNTERDALMKFAVGDPSEVNWVMGLDDSDENKWKVASGTAFGVDTDFLTLFSGIGAEPSLAEFTVTDSWALSVPPYGGCSDGDAFYIVDPDTAGHYDTIRKIDKATGEQLLRSADLSQGNGLAFRRIVTDSSYVYTWSNDAGRVRKYPCSTLVHSASSAAFSASATTYLCYWSGHLYLLYVTGTPSSTYVVKIRCSDMSTIWTRTFANGSGSSQMNQGCSLGVDGQYIYVADAKSGGNNRIVRLDMDGVWVNATDCTDDLYTNPNIWCVGDYVYDIAVYAGPVHTIEKRNKDDLGVAETFVAPSGQNTIQASSSSGFHYFCGRYTSVFYQCAAASAEATGVSFFKIRLRDEYEEIVDVGVFTGTKRLGVGTLLPTETIEGFGNIKATGGQFISTKPTGAPPLVVSSSTVVPNLNSDMVDGYHQDQSLLTTVGPSFDHLHLTVAAGTAPLVVASETEVDHLNAHLLQGNHAAAFEPALGNPATTGFVLSSTNAGVRSWVANASTFVALTDGPGAFTGHASQFVKVKADESALEYVASSVAAHALSSASHTDVDAAAPSDNDILRFDSASGMWKNEALGGGADHNLLSATHLDTTAAAAARGSLIIGIGASPLWTAYAKGAANQVLGGDGTDTKWVTACPAAAKYIVGAAHADLSAEKVKPQLYNNFDLDDTPASPNALDDEFDNSSLDGKWTIVNNPAGANAISETAYPGFIWVGLPELVTDTFDTLVRIYQTPPGDNSAWTIVIKASVGVQGLESSTDAGEFAGVGVYVGTAANDELIASVLQYNDAAGDTFACRAMGQNDMGVTTFTNPQIVPSGGTYYLKLEKATANAFTSANTYNTYYSFNGIVWYHTGQHSKTFTGACDEMGIIFRAPKAQGGTPIGYAIVDFFRRTV